ncbi:uncharacterized protein BDR25DRAFT_286732 [Lindgomyces ingoldianus]|uniref:Uncharacterized protein n=1 Tax=Lindgomyces ingoldianus TaxID=673940 RepID=A0ACB6QUT5_9PLEO|nr:uncharacterized protein BDR25DRAFT_286732 [Lindgomyces ingoldianus]KAF2470627.1 hypothetical protein BDR25DRAFT_286732 [Lindgomyces ingoldianus]
MDATISDISTKMKDTQLSTPTPLKKKLGFTELPPSIRNNIYKHVLDTEFVNVGKPNVSYTHSIKDNVLQFSASRPPFPISPALFYVNKQISKEAIQYFYSQNLFVRFTLYSSDARHAKTMLEDSGVLFSVAAPEAIEKSTQHAMDISLVEKNSMQKRAAVFFPAQYLPRLINFLDQASRSTASWAPSHAVFITLLNTYSFGIAKLQGDLLELFRILTNLGKVEIEGEALLPGYAEGLQASMLTPVFSTENWLATLTAMTAAADQARENRDWDLGIQHSQSVIIAMTYGYLTRAEALHSQPNAEDFAKSIQRLRWRNELSIGKALFKKWQSLTSDKNWLTTTTLDQTQRKEAAQAMLAAETATSHALSLVTDSPNPNSNPWVQSLPVETIPQNKAEWFTDDDKGITWYACGIVHLLLNEPLFAAGDLERATRLKPGGKNFEDAFGKARESIDWEVKPGVGLQRAAKVARS